MVSFLTQLARMYLAGAGGSTRAISTGGAADGGHTATAVGRGSSEVCVATVCFGGGGGTLSAVKKLAASGAGDSAVIFLVGVNFTSNYNETTRGEEISHLIKNTNQ